MRRNPVVSSLVVVVVLVLVGGIGVSSHFAVTASGEATAARAAEKRVDDEAKAAKWNESLAKDINHAIKIALALRAGEQSDWERMRQLLEETQAEYGQTFENGFVRNLWVKHAFPLKKLIGHRSGVSSVAFSPDGRRIVTGGGDKRGEVKVWDAETSAEKLALQGHTSAVLSVAFSLDGTRIVTGSDDTTARVWDAQPAAER